MKKIVAFLAAATLSALALPSLPAAYGQTKTRLPVAKFQRVSKAIAGQYIVVFKDNIARARIAPTAHALASLHGGRIMFTYEVALKGFAVELPEAAAIALSKNPQVEYVEENGFAIPFGSESTPDDASTFWGIDRIDQRDRPLSQTYTYNRVGSGVHAYILDTGIWITHQEFGTRAHGVDNFLGGYDSYGGDGIDRSPHSHGTKVAGVIGGNKFGVAKNVQLHSVKVCDYDPSYGYEICPDANIIAGLEWVAAYHRKPAVANMSFGGSPNTSIDNAVRNTSNAGVTCVAAAGNNDGDASDISPARVWEAITVGATSEMDSKASYSNYGSVLDLWAPGSEYTIGEYIPVPASGYYYGGRNDVTDGFSGTSAAAPHVTGVVALYMESYSLYAANDPSTLPANVRNALAGNATPNRISGIYPPSPNLLLYSSFVAPPASNPIDDSRFFVRQHYYDFLERQPDPAGLDYWTSQITACGSDAICLDQKRIDVSRAFWYAPEFLQEHPGLRNPPGVSPDFDNREFVRLCYLVYLQREPDQAGWDHWTNDLNNDIASGVGYDHLIKAFLVSPAYRDRFGG